MRITLRQPSSPTIDMRVRTIGVMANFKRGKRHYKNKARRMTKTPHGYWSQGFLDKVKAGLK
ncbi:MAG: hypothetical protein KGJ89_05500 [Patescibacteria group bacterium]|nr:hypothetical protein [Patescibacteria group bacterium]MDE2227377.1 hypothetical protein [Patescibacteria group bacterium]